MRQVARIGTCKSKPPAAIHEMATVMFEAGVVDKQTMRHFDESCLTPVHAFAPKEVRMLRERER